MRVRNRLSEGSLHGYSRVSMQVLSGFYEFEGFLVSYDCLKFSEGLGFCKGFVWNPYGLRALYERDQVSEKDSRRDL